MSTIYRGKYVTITALSPPQVQFAINDTHHGRLWVTWGDPAEMIDTNPPTTVARLVNDTGWLYLSEVWLRNQGIPYSTDDKWPATLGHQEVYSPVPVTVRRVQQVVRFTDELQERAYRINLDDERSFQGASDVLRSEFGAVGRVNVSGEWLARHGLDSPRETGFHERQLHVLGLEVTFSLDEEADGAEYTANPYDPRDFALPSRVTGGASPTSIRFLSGERGMLGITERWYAQRMPDHLEKVC